MIPEGARYLQQTGASAPVIVGAWRGRRGLAVYVDRVQVGGDEYDPAPTGRVALSFGDDVPTGTAVDHDVL